MESKKIEKKTVREYLDGLVWDKHPRVDRWLIDYGKAVDAPYIRAVSRLMLVAAVRRVRQPGCAFDEMLILEGPQGIGKSTALQILAGPWYGNDLPIGADVRHFMEVTAGKWIVEASELRAMGSGDVNALKACLSRTEEMVRMPYAREATKVPRQFIVVGTTSVTDYLRDPTSNRRLWPVRVDRFDLDRLRADRDQLWAEAASIEAAGESLRELIGRVVDLGSLGGR
jgi:predicted P-loop ATPase